MAQSSMPSPQKRCSNQSLAGFSSLDRPKRSPKRPCDRSVPSWAVSWPVEGLLLALVAAATLIPYRVPIAFLQEPPVQTGKRRISTQESRIKTILCHRFQACALFDLVRMDFESLVLPTYLKRPLLGPWGACLQELGRVLGTRRETGSSPPHVQARQACEYASSLECTKIFTSAAWSRSAGRLERPKTSG